MSKHKHHQPPKKSAIVSPKVKTSADFDRAMSASRSFYQNAVNWSSSLLTDARDEYSLDDATVARLYAINVTSWVCANYRAGVEASLPLMIGAGKSEEPVELEDNPLTWFLDNQSWLMFQASISLLIWGKFYFRKVRNVRGIPVRLEWLNPLDVSEDIDYQSRRFLGFRVFGRDLMVSPEDMITRRTFDPLNDFAGVSPYEVAMRQVESGRSMIRFAQKYFADGTMIGGMLTYTGTLEDEEYKQVKAEFDQFKGSQNAFKTYVVGGGLATFDYKPMAMPLVDLAMPDLKDSIDGDICRSFGVNPVLVGIGDAKDPLSAQNTYEQIEDKFILRYALPRVEWVLECFNEQWVRRDLGYLGDLQLMPDRSQINAASRSTPERSTAALANAGRIWTVNEARDYTGQPALPFPAVQINPDWAMAVYREGGIRHSEFRMAIGLPADPSVQDGYIWAVDPRVQQVALPNPPKNLSAPPAPAQIAARSADAFVQDEPIQADIIPTPPMQSDPLLTKARLWELDSWNKKIKHRGEDVAFEFKHLPDPVVSFVRSELAGLWNRNAVFSEARAAIREGRDPQPIGATPEQATNYWREYDALQHDLGVDFQKYMLALSEAAYTPMVEGKVGQFDEIAAPLHAGIIEAWVGSPDAPGPLYALMLAGMAAGDRTLKTEQAANPKKARAFPIDVSFNIASNEALQVVRTYGFDLIKQIDAVTKDGIRKALEDYTAKGLNMTDLQDAIANVLIPPGAVMTDKIKQRALAIGQSESIAAYNQGAFTRWLAGGVTLASWQTVRDSKVCDICRPLQGVVADIRVGWTSPTNGKTYTNRCHTRGRCFRKPVL